ncbi:MAG: flagellar biosynthetic protein FliP, partial [Acetanaerobacterium sp.]
MIKLSKATAKRRLKKPMLRFVISLIAVVVLAMALLCIGVHASEPGISIQIGGAETGQDRVEALDVLFLMTILALLPSILIMMTSFTRIVIVLSLLRNAMGLQQTPPNQVIIGLALFLSFFIMSPVISTIETTAYTPYVEGTITQEEAIDLAS